MIIRSKIFDCQHGPGRKKNEKDKSCTQKVKYDRLFTFISSCRFCVMNKCQKTNFFIICNSNSYTSYNTNITLFPTYSYHFRTKTI